MPVAFYMDVHVPQAITDQLRRRQVDVLTSIEDGRERTEDHDLLERARDLRRGVFTQDIRFYNLAQHWQGGARQFAGLVFAHSLGATIGELVRDWN